MTTEQLTDRDPYPTSAPRDDLGKPIAPEPYFHDWDDTPHAIFTVGVGQVDLGDMVLGGTHQVEGKGRAEQRGVPAVRLDLEYRVTKTMEASARLILPVDHQLEIKRYFPNAGHRYAWLQLREGEHQASLVPDFGDRTDLCDVNPQGYDTGVTVCDDCIDSWRIDYEVIRHG
jgi:hypothetical protein